MIGGLLKSTSSLAILAAAGLLIGGVTLAPKAARAADLGGDCCADLEERVANLEATTVRKGNRKVSLTITGRVAATMTYWSESSTGTNPAENGPFDQTSNIYFGDHTGNGPQVIFKGEGKISSDLVAGYYMEVGNAGIAGGSHNNGCQDAANDCTADSQGAHQAPGASAFTTANTYVYLNSKSLGQLQLGHTDNAGDEYNVNYDGSWMGGYTAGRAGTGFNLRETTTGEYTGLQYGSALSTLEPGGENGLRYISPSFGGFSVTGSVGGDRTWGVGANYAGTFKTVSVGFGVGYGAFSRVDGASALADVGFNELGVSAGIKESTSGLFISGDWSRKHTNGLTPDPTNWFVNGGWAKNVSGAGDTTIHVAYDRSNDVMSVGSVAHTWAVGIDQHIDAAASHVFLTYENTALDNPGTSVGEDLLPIPSQNVNTLTAGMSVEF